LPFGSANLSAQLIYSENFGRANSASGAADPGDYNWAALGGTTSMVGAISYTGPSGSPFGVAANVGAPLNAPQINAGTDLQGTNGQGLLFSSVNTAHYRYLLTTSEYSFDPSSHPDLTFSWYGGNSVANTTQRLALQVGGNWYTTSNQVFTVPQAAGGGDFASNATQHSVNFSTASWLNLTTSGSLQLGSATSLPSGNITGFGVYSEFGSTAGTNRIDTFQITAIPEPSSLGLLGVGLALMALRRRYSRA
jgi:hypothetical protein